MEKTGKHNQSDYSFKMFGSEKKEIDVSLVGGTEDMKLKALM